MVKSVRHAALLSAAIAIWACAGNRGPIVVGVVGPFSQARGTSMKLAAQLARDEINAAGGVRGRPLELRFLDDSASADAAVRAAQALYDDPNVVAVVGHLTSGTTLAAAPIYNGGANPVVEISPSASSPEVTSAGAFTFRTCPTDLVHGAALAEWARRRLEARTVAVIYQNDDYGRGVRGTFADNFRALGGTVVAQDPYTDDIASFEPYLAHLKQRGGADALMIAGTRAGAERILATLDSVGLHPKVLGGDGLSGIESASARAESVFISSAYLADQPGTGNAAFVRAYRHAYDNQTPDHRGAGAYDILHLLARAIGEAGSDRQAIRDYVASVGTTRPAFNGVTGPIAFDADGDVPHKSVVVGVVHNGRLVTAGQ